MDLFLLHPDIYAQRYYCSQLSIDEWYSQGEARPFMGIFLILMGVVLESIYLPFIITMLQRKFISMSCYKLMFFLGITDFIQIYGGSLFSGFLTLKGAVFCTNPTLIYINGLIGLASWCGSCITVMILTINRCTDIYFPEISRALFHGNRTWFWLIIPISVMFWVIAFESAPSFNSRYLAWFFDPYIGMDPSLHPKINGIPIVCPSTLHFINNLITVSVLCVGNAVLCYYVFTTSERATSMSKFKRQLVIQICVICLLETFCSFIYAYMQFFYTPAWLILLGSISYQMTCGMLALTYLFLNPTLRKAACNLFCRFGRRVKIYGTGSLFQTQESRNTNRTVTEGQC